MAELSTTNRPSVLALLILVGGLFVLTMMLTPGSMQAGSIGIACSGYSNASVNANFSSAPDPDHLWSLSFKGKTPRKWRWIIRPAQYYEQLDVTWETWQDSLRKGSFTVKLPSLEYRSGDSSGVLTKELLNVWLTGRPVTQNGACDPDVQTAFDYIPSAGDGTLPAPRHHTHTAKSPLGGTIHHGVGGFQLPVLPMLAWLLIWFVLAGFPGIRRSHRA